MGLLTVGVKPWQPRIGALNCPRVGGGGERGWTHHCLHSWQSKRSVGLTKVKSTVTEGKGLRAGRTGFASGH